MDNPIVVKSLCEGCTFELVFLQCDSEVTAQVLHKPYTRFTPLFMRRRRVPRERELAKAVAVGGA